MTDTTRTTELRETVERFWATAEARDWDAFADTLADDVVYTLPQTRERVSGKERFVRFNREYPSDWHLRTERVVAEPGQVVTWLRFTVGPEEMHALSFFTGDENGNIATITDFWPEPYEPPASRDHLKELTERY
ncbi:nuclear transport factor 2 family protein [Streptomyces sp. SID12501]|uniref:Nuclear transport factor 2 family protein n=1 Tax=Streptomyces sp. SID12501 TaxID=2706042 RepID=A0A6B3BH99_9ACTN|nr:nuclear transport factor 2 family protein [Streptomyces sp. SID12501]NEC85140.1 nuclear transport factor 2 family protein [Streptomyces sp. SID12501]